MGVDFSTSRNHPAGWSGQETGAASDERAGEVAQTRMESTEFPRLNDDDDMSATSATGENNSNNIDGQERHELFNEGVAIGFQLGLADGLAQASSLGVLPLAGVAPCRGDT